MKLIPVRLLALGSPALLSLLALPRAEAVTYIFDISGLESEDPFSVAFPTLTHDFGIAGVVTRVSWDVNFESFAPSWNNEAQIAIDTDNDIGVDADIDPGFFGALDIPGPFSYRGTMAADTLSENGLVHLTLYEFFNDPSTTPDALYGDNSRVTIEYEPVPEPGVLGSLLITGVAVAVRRRARPCPDRSG